MGNVGSSALRALVHARGYTIGLIKVEVYLLQTNQKKHFKKNISAQILWK